MVRNIVVLGGNSHPQLTETICEHLGVAPSKATLSKFSVGETRVEIHESVRGKDVYIIQSGGGKVNDHVMELLIAISACKTASANKVTAVLPLFPYSRQSDIPYNKTGAPLAKTSTQYNNPDSGNSYTFESTPPTPHPNRTESPGLPDGVDGLNKSLSRTQIEEMEANPNSPNKARFSHYANVNGNAPKANVGNRNRTVSSASTMTNGGHEEHGSPTSKDKFNFQPRSGYRQWVAQAGTLVADLLTCAGADHVITMDLHDPQYQGFFDIPVDNLYGRPLLKRYITHNIPDYKNCVIVSPDAGGAKRATAIADQLGMPFALIHKVGPNISFSGS